MLKYLTTTAAAAQSGLSVQRIRKLCLQGRINGAMQHGKAWMIPDGFTIKREGTRGPKGVQVRKETK